MQAFLRTTRCNPAKCKKIIHHDQVEFIAKMQACFNTRKAINVIHLINRMKSRNKMIFQGRVTGNAFEKVQHPSMRKLIRL